MVLEEGTDTTRVIPIEIHVASKQKETIHGSIPENKPPGSLVKLKSKLPNTDSGNLQHAHSLPFELTQNGQLVTRQALGAKITFEIHSRPENLKKSRQKNSGKLNESKKLFVKLHFWQF